MSTEVIGSGAAVIKQMISVAAGGYSTTIGGINQFSTAKAGGDIYGANFNVRADGSFSAVELTTSSPYSKGTLSFDTLSLNGEINATGVSGEVGAEAINISSDWKMPWVIKDTAFYIHSEAGLGAKASVNFNIDMSKGNGKIGGKFGAPITRGFELRWKNVKRW